LPLIRLSVVGLAQGITPPRAPLRRAGASQYFTIRGSNQLDRTFQMSLPAVSRGDAAQVLQLSVDPVGGQVLFLYINFTIQDHDIHGYIAIVMDVPVISSLKVLLQNYIARMTQVMVRRALPFTPICARTD
jgi:hypothetical protein